MKLLRLLALVSIVSGCCAQTLIFRSGFEPNMAIGAIPPTQTGGYTQPTSGTDLSTGYTWPLPLWAPSVMGPKAGGGFGTPDVNHYSSTFLNETGHTGGSTRVMRLTVSGFANGFCCPQYVFQSNGLTQAAHGVYYSIWTQWPSSMAGEISGVTGWGDEQAGWKTSDDYRETLGLTRPGSSGTTIRANAQADPCGISGTCPYSDPITGSTINAGNANNWQFSFSQNNSYSVPIGQWVHLELYETRIHGPGGVMAMAMNGNVIGYHTFTSSNYGSGNHEIQDFYWTNLYGGIYSVYPETQDYDDMEVWDSPPCGHFPCDAQVGGIPPDFRNWQGAVGATGTAFSYQPVVANATSYSASGLPAGLSMSSSTGLISGTPSAAGTSTVQLHATNSTGTATQFFKIQINSSIVAPVIKSFGAYPTSVTSGGASTLYTNVLGAGTVTMSINQGVGTVTGLSNSRVVNPISTTTYTLTASNSAGSTSASTTVTAVGGPPVISSFTANPSVISPGSSSTLSIATSGATSCSINQGVGTVSCNGPQVVTPSITTLYTLTATNTNGSTPAQTQVTVSGPANYFVSSSGGNDSNAGTSSTLPWQSLAKVKSGPVGGYQPGSSVFFKTGDTWSGVSMNTLSAGTSAQRITYGSYGAGAKPIIDGTFTVGTLFTISDDFITLDGLDLRNSTSQLITAPGRDGIIVRNCSFRNAGGHVFNSSFAIAGSMIFDNNTYTVDAGRPSSTNMVEIWTDQNASIRVTDNTLDRRFASGALNGSGIAIPGAWGAVLTGNIVRGGTQGIGVKPYQRPQVGPNGDYNCNVGDPDTRNGIISHNYIDNISVRQGDGELVEAEGCPSPSAGGNQIGMTISENVLVCMTDTTVGVGSSDAVGGFHAVDSKVWGNLIFGGCHIATGSTTPRIITFSSASTNNNVYNNTIVGPGIGVSPFPLSAIAYLSGSSGIARNNIITGVERGVAQYSSSTVSQGNNLFFNVSGNTFGTVTDLGNTLVGDPLFAVTNPTDANGAKLRSGSPAIGSGANLGTPYNFINDPNGAGPFIYPDFNQSSLWMRGAFGFGSGPPPPIISDFEANPTSINSGQSSQLTCTASNFTNLQIVGVGNIASGVPITVSPTVSTTYDCRATNTVTHVDVFATVSVNAPPPVITSFTANPVTIITGQSSTLQWTTTGATTCSINNGVGTVTCNTSMAVSPTTTTTYRLTATNSASVSVFQDTTIAVNVPTTILGATMQGAIIP